MNASTPPAKACDATAVAITPSGRGAVAVVVVEGADAAKLVDACFRPLFGSAISSRDIGRIVFGRWGDAVTGEEVVACRKSHSQVEIHCHGGAAAVARILDDLVARGASTVDWRTWRMQSAPDVIEAEADIALAAATTERTARILLDQRQGTLRTAVLAAIECIDNGNLDEAATRVQMLLDRYSIGRRWIEPWRVVLAGAPNVGKSSLINRLLGYERAIVFDQPGTTRDVVTATTALDGWPVELSDTAGLRESDDPIERAGVARAREQIERADLIILVAEATSKSQVSHTTPAASLPFSVDFSSRSTPILHVENKCDLASTLAGHPWPSNGETLRTSAKTGMGIAELAAAIVAKLVPRPPVPGEGAPFTDRQTQLLEVAALALGERRAGDANEALQHIIEPPAD